MKVLVHRIKKYWGIFIYFKKVNFLERLAYRFNLLWLMFGAGVQITLNLVFFNVIFSWVEKINGWEYHQVLMIAGTVWFLEGICWTFFGFFNALRKHIRQGQLDGILIKPIDGQFLELIYRGDLENFVDTFLGLGVIIFAAWHTDLTGLGLFLGVVGYSITLFNALVIICSISMILNTIAFWTIESGTSQYLVNSILRAGQYPTDIFKGKVFQLILASVLPIAFVGTVPAKIFFGGFNLWLVLGSTSIALIFLGLSRLIWRKGLDRYASASS